MTTETSPLKKVLYQYSGTWKINFDESLALQNQYANGLEQDFIKKLKEMQDIRLAFLDVFDEYFFRASVFSTDFAFRHYHASFGEYLQNTTVFNEYITISCYFKADEQDKMITIHKDIFCFDNAILTFEVLDFSNQHLSLYLREDKLFTFWEFDTDKDYFPKGYISIDDAVELGLSETRLRKGSIAIDNAAKPQSKNEFDKAQKDMKIQKYLQKKGIWKVDITKTLEWITYSLEKAYIKDSETYISQKEIWQKLLERDFGYNSLFIFDNDTFYEYYGTNKSDVLKCLSYQVEEKESFIKLGAKDTFMKYDVLEISNDYMWLYVSEDNSCDDFSHHRLYIYCKFEENLELYTKLIF